MRLKSELGHDEIVKIMKERAPEFRAIDGLVQKYYLQATEPGEYVVRLLSTEGRTRLLASARIDLTADDGPDTEGEA